MTDPETDTGCELLAPAGSFSSAIHALEHGADAVYLGLPRFSARKNARNFTLEEFARLRTAADGMKKKLYVAANTVFREEETEDLLSTLYRARLYGMDAVIVQDYGLPRMIRRCFPDLPLHASTQMAVHNAAGVRTLQDLGFSRVILARELTFEEIRALRTGFPDMEFEVFIHGALCYGFSGLCLASGFLLGRSGNRGECAQICRTWFEHESGKGYFFSSNDLSLEEEILALRDTGITSFKIEGRMKPPEYSGLASSYYRAVLDGLPPSVRRERLSQLRTVFSRHPTKAFFRTPRGTDMLNSQYPGHLGIPLGRVVKTGGDGFDLLLSEKLSVRDGILFSGKGIQPAMMGVQDMVRNGRRIYHASPGDRVHITSSEKPTVDEIVRKVSSHNLRWQEIQPRNWKMRPVDVPVTATLTDSTLSFSARYPTPPGIGDFISCPTETGCSFPVTPEPSRSGRDFQAILSDLLAESGEYGFRAALTGLKNETSLDTGSVFIPLSHLKRARQEFYAAMDAAFQALPDQVPCATVKTLRSGGIVSRPSETGKGDMERLDNTTPTVPSRDLLVPEGGKPVPFITDPRSLSMSGLPSWGRQHVLPLAPVVFNEDEYFRDITAFLESRSGTAFLLGLNNAAHLSRARELSDLPNVSFFIDYGLYCANLSSYRFFTEHLLRLEFVYFWIEGSDEDFDRLQAAVRSLAEVHPGHRFPPLVRTGPCFLPPLLISRTCVFRHAFGESCSGCSRMPADSGTTGHRPREPVVLEQNGKRFQVLSRRCVTYVFPS